MMDPDEVECFTSVALCMRIVRQRKPHSKLFYSATTSFTTDCRVVAIAKTILS